MQTRRSTKGPGQGDSAVAEEVREERERKVEEPTETKPSLTADLPGRAEKEVEVLKETTSKLAQEVRIRRGFAQDTLELIKELREERLGARQPQPVHSYYGAQDTPSQEKSTLQGLVQAPHYTGRWGLCQSRENRRLHYPPHLTEL